MDGGGGGLDAENAPMIRMPIVSSEQGGLPALGTCAKSRAAVFACGIVATVMLFVMAGMVVVPGGGRAADEPGAVTMEISLFGDERYVLQRHRTLAVTAQRNDEEPVRSTSSVAVRYGVTKFCGTRSWSYLRFAVLSYSQSESGDAVVGDTAGESVASTDYGNYLEEAMSGHTFTANLTHSGCVAYRDETNMRSTIRNVLNTYERVVENEDLRNDTGLREHLAEIGERAVEDVEETSYNYLLASPPNISVGRGESWFRPVRDGGSTVHVAFAITDEVTSGAQPVVSGANSTVVEQRRAEYPAGDSQWLIVETGNGKEVAVDNRTEYYSDYLAYSGILDALNADVESVDVNATAVGKLVIGGRSGLVVDSLTTVRSELLLGLTGRAGATGARKPATGSVARAMGADGRGPARPLAAGEKIKYRMVLEETETGEGWIQARAMPDAECQEARRTT